MRDGESERWRRCGGFSKEKHNNSREQVSRRGRLRGGSEKRGEIKSSANTPANTIFCLSDYLL